ncbi:MAG: MMPL family transporter [Myxococcota bacterium]|nr:MMPL family transporter [Myxococcota bacterium]
MEHTPRDRWFNHLGHIAINRPRTVLAATLVSVLIGLALAPGLPISTSRQGLVERENPHQKRMLDFLERFGDPTSPVFFVVSGGVTATRRDAVDQLVDALSTEPQFQEKIVARMGPQQIAEALLLQSPQAPRELQSLAPSDVDLTTFVEGGLPAYIGALKERLANLAAGLQMRMLMPFGANVPPAQVNAILGHVNTLARTTDAYLAGENPWTHFNMEAKNFTMVDSAGYIVGQGNDYLMVSLFPDFEGDEVHHQKPVIEKIRSIRDRLVASGTLDPALSIQLTGLPTLAVDELRIIEEGLFQSSFATGIGILILFLIAFRSFRQSLFAGVPLVIGIILTLAFVRLTYGQLNLITSSFISVLLGLGIDFPVHLLSRFNEFRRKGFHVTDSILMSLRTTGPGIMTGAVTTILAFLTTTTTEFTAFAELGVITSVGLLLMVLATFFVLPNLIYRLESKRDVVKPELPGISQVTSIVTKAPALLLILGIIAAVAGGIGLDQIRFNYRYFDFLPQETESAQALRMLEEDLAMGPTFANVTAESVEEARELTEKLRKLPSVASVQTATDILPPLEEGLLASLQQFIGAFPRQPDFTRIATASIPPAQLAELIGHIGAEVEKIQTLFQLTGQSQESSQQALDGLQALRKRLLSMGPQAEPLLTTARQSISGIIERAWTTARDISGRGQYVPSDIPPILQQRFVSRSQDALALYVYPRGNIWNRQFATQFSKDLSRFDPDVSGFAITLHAHSSMILAGFKRAAMLAVVFILLLLLYDFRKPSLALLALTPTTVGWLWMLGIMASWNIPFNVANIVVLPLVLGIGIDAGVHMVHRYEESRRLNEGVARLSDLLSGTGSAVVLASVTTIVGFAGLMIADYGGMKSLGLVMVLGISCCLGACLLILPAILILLRRAR